MEDYQVVASSSLEEAPVLADGEVGKLIACNEYHGDNSSKDGSWLDDSDEEADGASYLDREWKTRREQFYNTGYRDGISAGKNDAAQQGFNDGLKDSMVSGYKWGIVRGVTSALAHLPDEVKVKLVEAEESRREFLKLHEAVDSIGTEDAVKFFYDDIKKVKSNSSLTHQSGKLESLLKQCPMVDVCLEFNQNRVT